MLGLHKVLSNFSVWCEHTHTDRQTDRQTHTRKLSARSVSLVHHWGMNTMITDLSYVLPGNSDGQLLAAYLAVNAVYSVHCLQVSYAAVMLHNVYWCTVFTGCVPSVNLTHDNHVINILRSPLKHRSVP